MLTVGVVGYCMGGQHFHTPSIAAAAGCSLAAVVARAAEPVAKARADWPDIPICPSLSALIPAGVCDAVTITHHYVISTTDMQAQDRFAGRRPVDDPAGWGYEPEAN